MEVQTRKVGVIEVDPLDQASIDAAKARAPGEGVGIAVAGEILSKIADGNVNSISQIPSEYLHLGVMVGLTT